MQLNFEEDEDLDSYILSTQRLHSNKSHSETDQSSPLGLSKNQIMLPESPLMLKQNSESPLNLVAVNKHLSSVKGNAILPDSPLITRNNNMDSPMLKRSRSRKNQILPLDL